MPNIISERVIPVDQDIYAKVDADSLGRGKGPVGTLMVTDDGRRFRYARTENTIGLGQLCIAVVNIDAIAATYFGATTALAPVAGEGGSIGDRILRVCATGVTANEHQGGWLMITDGTGISQLFKVKKNGVSATGGFLIHIYGELSALLDATSVGLLMSNPFHNVDHTAHANFGGNQNQYIVGRAMAACAGTSSAPDYVWLQTRGISMLVSGVAPNTHGGILTVAEDVDGVVQLSDTGDRDPGYQPVAIALQDGADTVGQPCYLILE